MSGNALGLPHTMARDRGRPEQDQQASQQAEPRGACAPPPRQAHQPHHRCRRSRIVLLDTRQARRDQLLPLQRPRLPPRPPQLPTAVLFLHGNARQDFARLHAAVVTPYRPAAGLDYFHLAHLGAPANVYHEEYRRLRLQATSQGNMTSNFTACASEAAVDIFYTFDQVASLPNTTRRNHETTNHRLSASLDHRPEARQTGSAKARCRQGIRREASAATRSRPQLEAMLGHVREGDHIKVWSIDRLDRSMTDLGNIIEDLRAKGVSIHFESEGMTFDPSKEADPYQKIAFQGLGSFAEFERAISRRRQAEGIAKAKESGRYQGRKRILTDEQVHAIRKSIRPKRSACAPGTGARSVAHHPVSRTQHHRGAGA